MTDPKLREARIARAKEMANETWGVLDGDTFVNHVAIHLCDLIEQDWRPEPEVDAVTLAAREWTKATPLHGDEDITGYALKVFRAGHAHALANCADVRRMDWLERANFIQATSEGGGYLAACFGSELRDAIDRTMEGGQ